MRVAVKVAAHVAVFAFMLGSGAAVSAADAPAVVGQIEAHNKAFLAAYEDGDLAKMKSEVKKAVALGEKNGLTTNAVMADTYVLAAILEVDGNENNAAGVRAFVKALKIRSDVAIPKGMATSPVKLALKQARAEAGGAPEIAAAPAPASKPAEAAKTETIDKAAAEKTAEDKAATDKTAQKAPEKSDKQKATETAAEKARADAEAKQKEKQAREDRDRQEKETRELAAQAQKDKEAESKERAVSQKDRAEKDKQVAELKGRVQQLEKDKADRDKQLADAKTRIQQLEKDKADRDKQLADAKGRSQQLEKDKADRDKQLADAKGRSQQLEKDKVEQDKQLAEARAKEAKERESREKVEHERQLAEAKQRELENKRKEEQQNRERLFAGPEMPGHLSEALTCAVPDEAPLRNDLFVHCVARPNVKAKTIIFYYRAGTAHYTSVPMARTAKGWYAAIVPGARVTGKAMQYYAEALDGREAVVARNGKETSPNILTLRPGVPRG